MNIAFFTDTYLPQINGVVTSIEIFREALEKKGHNVYIYAPYIGGKSASAEKNVFRFKSAKFIFQPEYRISLPYSRSLNKFSKLDIDIVHCHTPFSMGLLGIFMAKKYNKPLVHTYHTMFSEYVHYLPIPGDYAKNFAIWASKSFCNSNHLVIVPSIKVKEELINYNVTTPIEVIPTGIVLTDYHKIFTTEAEKTYNLSKDLIYITTISRLGKEKNIPFLLKTFAVINSSLPQTRFIIIGDGPEKKNLLKEAEKLGILDKIIFTGYIERNLIFPLLKMSRAFIFASKTETQGLVILEALSMKVPAVAIDAMGVSSILEDNLGGMLSTENEQEFADKVLKLISDEKLHEQKSNEAYKKALSLSANKMARKLIECYRILSPDGC
ncbi:MAG: glycosyltransferase family 4 protein [Candidatus Margulisbacteria bacterium]|nr:glycosyltransferase family 4 protein [Candidatus Margulisiibacteriota bacterium]